MTKKSAKVEVSNIVLNIRDTKIELSLDEARELKAALDGLLGNETTPSYIPVPYPFPYSRPYWKWEPYYYTTTKTMCLDYRDGDASGVTISSVWSNVD
jgi:hypothetical protein